MAVDELLLVLYSLGFGTSLALYSTSATFPERYRDGLSGVDAAVYFWLLVALRLVLFPSVLSHGGPLLGRYFRAGTGPRRHQILSWAESEERALAPPRPYDEDWEKVDDDDDDDEVEGKRAEAAGPASDEEEEYAGVIGFFHPFCDAGGGGERVLWAAIRATQRRYPKALCVVYTGDHDVTKSELLDKVKDRFDIELDSPHLTLLYLSARRYVLASTWPRFTLLGQSLGSLLLALDAFRLLVPDVLVDTMGYAFVLALAKCFFPQMPTGAYVHYPTISTDMLGSLDADEGQGLNAGAGRGWRGRAKRQYWRLFARLYGGVGGSVDVVMANSSWTRAHLRALWGPSRSRKGRTSDVELVFPPVAVEELERAIEVGEESERKRERIILYIAQFRPEKNHELVLRAFSELLRPSTGEPAPPGTAGSRLVLVGSVRDGEDAKRVYRLRLLANELKIKDDVEFVANAPWPDVLRLLARSSVGVNGMWNEHFGIGVVEYQAAGLIAVVNDSGGPKQDIVIDHRGEPTGFHAATVLEYSAAFARALTLPPAEALAMRLRARASARRFSEAEFDARWLARLERLVGLHRRPEIPRASVRLWALVAVFGALVVSDLVLLAKPFVVGHVVVARR